MLKLIKAPTIIKVAGVCENLLIRLSTTKDKNEF